MFHPIPERIFSRMKELEELDSRDRIDGTQREKRLRQIPPDTGRFLALMAAIAPPGRLVEVGTSAGYSALWISLANRRLITLELLPGKIALAEETFSEAGIEHLVELVEGDALDQLPSLSEISFCFLDTEKDLYEPCYDLVVPRMVPGAILVCDNVMSHGPLLQPMIDSVMADPRMDAAVLPIGKGLLFGVRSEVLPDD